MKYIAIALAALALSGCAQLTEAFGSEVDKVMAMVPEYCKKRDKHILRKMVVGGIALAATEPVANVYDEAVWKVCEWNGVTRPAEQKQASQ